jgi:catechol 2,3-dioxygenase-like lactoylglutathione lyase family enzyme
LKRLLLLLPLLTALGAERPPIVGIANFVVKTDNLDDVRKFYTGVLGYDEVFKHRRPGVPADIAVFKVNDHQYIEVTQTLANEADDKLIQIGFETRDARKLRDYLAEKGVGVPARIAKDEDGNYSCGRIRGSGGICRVRKARCKQALARAVTEAHIRPHAPCRRPCEGIRARKTGSTKDTRLSFQ